MAKAEYRSSIRSKNLIKHAFAKLLVSKPISKITVTDIIQTADISRGTFYAHYTDVISVMERIIEEEIQNLIYAAEEFNVNSFKANPDNLIHAIINHINDDFDYYKNLLNNNEVSALLMKKLTETFCKKCVAATAELPGIKSEEEAKVFLIYTVNGFRLVVSNWLNDSFKMTADELAIFLYEIIRKNKEYCNIILPETK